MTVTKLEPGRWESVEDLARWLLTHADEFEQGIVVLRERRRQAGDPTGDLKTFACPTMPIVEALGLLEVAKHMYVEDAKSS